MQHYFGEFHNGEIALSKEDLHHLDVRRTKLGEKVEVGVGDSLFLCVVSSLSPLRLEIVEEIREKREPDNEIAIAFCLLKGEHNDFIVEKCTELGASRLIPVLSSRVIVKPQGKEDQRLLRLRKIARESSMQCRRAKIPSVEGYTDFEECLKIQADLRLFAYEGCGEKAKTILEESKNLQKGQSVLVLIGPEGGFSEEEAQKALQNGFREVSLGRRILRGETAAIASCGLLGAISEGEERE